MNNSDRKSLLDLVMADMPQVHTDFGNPEGGVWRTDKDCYEFILQHCDGQSQTLETGLGVSTLLFVQIGCLHTCIAPWKAEIDKFCIHCRERQIATNRLTLIQGFSDKVLPSLPQSDLDLMLIDGGHGFPTPVLDWYYGAGRLHQGGIVVIDDVHLPAVRLLTGYLDADPRWNCMAKTGKWTAYERLSQGPLLENHTRQSFWE